MHRRIEQQEMLTGHIRYQIKEIQMTIMSSVLTISKVMIAKSTLLSN